MGGICAKPQRHLISHRTVAPASLARHPRPLDLEERILQAIENSMNNAPAPPLPPLHRQSPSPSRTRALKSLNMLKIDTNVIHKWDKIEHTPITEEERQQYLFYCPICMCHSAGGASCKLCQHHTCFECAELILLKNTSKHSCDEMECPHCRMYSSINIITKASDILRTYIDSPTTRKKLQEQIAQEETKTVVDKAIKSGINRVALQMRHGYGSENTMKNNALYRTRSTGTAEG